MRFWQAGVVALLAAGLGPTAARGQEAPSQPAPAAAVAASPADSAIEATTKALASELRCPVCQGLSIQDSPSELALEMRDVIKEQLRSGRTPDQVRQYFLDKYGEWILLEPEPKGFNLIVYLLPVAAVLGGLVLVWRTVRRWTSPPPDAAPHGSSRIPD